ncbi:hypothetical protein DQ238_03290 [Geodermatophilus sp. TF02-6]|uniref:hypothetical protein n=1 Tax=Geodermatophilus sp. TF02-6 TaxID=2250575 RepID=UPI000DE90732|nr:hypothetical protein [Geodermatophilus sp. TF02-6]RBY83026.1 hypothetical protein DQ238_03290 [Geodermatophilus sp. TF02-6]
MTTTDPPAPIPGPNPGSRHLLEQIHLKELEIRRIPDEPVRGPRGQYMTRREARERHDFVKAEIDAAEAGGSLKHRTVRRSTKALTLLFLAVIDFPVMLWLVSSVFNVDWAHPVGLRLVISVVLSVLATAGAAWVLYHVGHIRRDDKNDRREPDWREMSVPARVSLVGVALLVILVSVVMFVRVFTEGVLSGLSGLALLLSVLVALIMLLSAALVFFTAFRDGSPEQEDLAHYSALVHDGERRQRRLVDDVVRLRMHHNMLEERDAGSSDGRSADGADAHVVRVDYARQPLLPPSSNGRKAPAIGGDQPTP